MQTKKRNTGGDDTPEESGIFNRIISSVHRGRRAIEKRVEATAIKLGLDPKPLIAGFREIILLLPRLLRLTLKLLLDSRVPLRLRVLCGLSLSYLISPMDIIPEVILGPVGFVDDIAIIIIVLDSLLNEVDPAIVKEHWSGDEDVLKIIKDSVLIAKWFLPARMDGAIKKFIKKSP